MYSLFVIFALIIILNASILYLYYFFQKSHSFFENKNFPTLKANFIFGNFGETLRMKKPMALCIYDLHRRLEPNKYGGIYLLNRPTVIITDAELVKDILIKDFDFFRDRGLEFKEGEEPLHNNLLRMTGDKWKNTRMKLSPFFTLAKMRSMFTPMQHCANRLQRILEQTNGEHFDIKVSLEQYTIDIIGNCAFGIDFMAMKNPDCLIRKMAKKIFQFRFQTIFRHLIPNLPNFLLKMLNLQYSDQEVEDFFTTTMTKAINLRRRTLSVRNDVIGLLLSKKTRRNVDLISDQTESEQEQYEADAEETSMEFKIAQCYLFFAAGFETTSSALAYLMMELALHQSIQTKVREEIIAVLEKSNGQITYESLKEMTYTEMVMAESLRLHPVAAVLCRKCTKTYRIPGTEATIPENMFLLVSVYGLHMDPKYYEKPDQFYPEHFTEEAKNSRPMCAYLPFGNGPRGCIGERFSKMEMKIAVVNMLKNYVFEISPKMKFPLEYAHDMKIGLLTPNNGIWLQCKKISN